MLGALFNAWLNRRRDDRLRYQEKLGLIVMVTAELKGIVRTLEQNSESLEDPMGGFYVPDPSHSMRLIPHVIEKLALLDI
jgi:hypothetical protein